MFFVVFCVLLCVREAVGSLGCLPLAHTLSTTYRTTYGIVLGVGISIVELDTHAILVKNLMRENGGKEKMTNQLCVLCVVKNCYLLPYRPVFKHHRCLSTRH
jgi:hypothetical protein